jgi:N-acetylmuramoyl-L-alanine amidase
LTLIWLDAGHGGTDPGAVGNGLRESDIVLDICRRIETLLRNFECRVSQTRTTDTFVSLANRTSRANAANADLFVSVHCNAFTNTTARGFETFRHTNAPARSTSFQNVIHDEIMKSMGNNIVDRGKKTSNFHVLRETRMAACLTEVLFVSNPAEARLLGDPAFRQRVAEGHANGIVKFLGLKRKPTPQPTPPAQEKFFRVQVGAFREEANALALKADLERQGYRPIIRYE